MTSEDSLRLNTVLAQAGLASLDVKTNAQFEIYVSLIVRWNAKLNLISVRTEGSILSRHLAESIACAEALPHGIGKLLDFGSGAGFPGIPIALCRPEIAVTLAESQGKKAAFLQEAVRVLRAAVEVYGGRAESLRETFDCVTLRAVDKMEKAVAAAVSLVAAGGWLALMTTRGELVKLQEAATAQFLWGQAVRLPFGDERILALGHRIKSEG